MNMRALIPLLLVIQVSVAQGQLTETSTIDIPPDVMEKGGTVETTTVVTPAAGGNEVHFSFGYAISRLTEPRIFLNANREIVEDTMGAGEFSTGKANAMMHLNVRDTPFAWKDRHWTGNAFSFGVGETDEGNKNYLFGYSWHVGHLGYLTIGWNWVRAPILRKGFKPGDVIPENEMTPLDKTVIDGWFFSVSYVVAGPDEGLVKWRQ